MGAWLADYFDDAGYITWETQASIYKARFNACSSSRRGREGKPELYSHPGVHSILSLKAS